MEFYLNPQPICKSPLQRHKIQTGSVTVDCGNNRICMYCLYYVWRSQKAGNSSEQKLRNG